MDLSFFSSRNNLLWVFLQKEFIFLRMAVRSGTALKFLPSAFRFSFPKRHASTILSGKRDGTTRVQRPNESQKDMASCLVFNPFFVEILTCDLRQRAIFPEHWAICSVFPKHAQEKMSTRASVLSCKPNCVYPKINPFLKKDLV